MGESTGAARPVPSPSPLTGSYWEAASRHELAIQRCASCGRYVHPPRPRCPDCDGEALDFEAVSGRGTLETFSVVHRTFAPGFATRTPYVLAWIALPEQEGLRITANVIETNHDDLRIGMPVEVVFEELEGFGPIPNFRGARAR